MAPLSGSHRKSLPLQSSNPLPPESRCWTPARAGGIDLDWQTRSFTASKGLLGPRSVGFDTWLSNVWQVKSEQWMTGWTDGAARSSWSEVSWFWLTDYGSIIRRDQPIIGRCRLPFDVKFARTIEFGTLLFFFSNYDLFTIFLYQNWQMLFFLFRLAIVFIRLYPV